ncbi:DUF2306 domain-containing protein [Pseudonocardia sp.]|uniref:DUF2306 domain-containing protein n=1 Tax=Pseudonocardia sp. TaxID=60912 RepID=UPI003D0D50FE
MPAARTVPPTGPPAAPRVRAAGLWWLALSALAIAVFAPLPYLLHPLRELAANGGEIAANYAPRPGWVRAALAAHVLLGGLALLLSPVQLSSRVRARFPRLHRVSGRVVLASIAVAGTAGFLLAWFTVAGPVGTAGFGLLAVLWMGFALSGLRAIRRRDVVAHRRWMLRTFAMTYAAVTLRLWLLVLIPLLGGFAAAYVLVPFLCWVPNLAVAELVLRRRSSA